MTDLERAQARAPEQRAPEPPPAPPERQGSGIASLLRLGLLVGLLVLAGALWGWSVAVVIFALIVMITLHELGHFLTARWTGMKATEFFLGFGPRLWSFRKGEVEYGVKAVPAGAYVRIIGMSTMDEVEPADEDRTYRSKSYPARVLVASAGSLMHFLLAFFLLFATFTMFGVPHASNWVIGTVSPESPAQSVGLQPSDRIVSVNGAPVTTFDSLTGVVRARPGEQVTLVVERDGEQVTLQPTLATTNPSGEHVGFLGIGPSFPYVKESAPSSVWASTKEFGNVTVRSVTGLGKLFSPNGLRGYVSNFSADPSDQDLANRPVSPVGAVNVGAQLARTGAADLFYFLAAVNIFVGLFNLLPLLPFDGGHIAVATYERIRSRKGKRYYADVTKMLPVTYAVLALVLLMFVGNLYLDIFKPIKL